MKRPVFIARESKSVEKVKLQLNTRNEITTGKLLATNLRARFRGGKGARELWDVFMALTWYLRVEFGISLHDRPFD